MFKVTIIADTIWEKHRITTFELEYPRFIHSELMTHRMFSRNASSSRAIPVETMIQLVVDNPVVPTSWGLNQKGMVADQNLPDDKVEDAIAIWLTARDYAVAQARELAYLGVHKQLANRLLEPFQTMKTIVTATEWANFFQLRTHKDAQPEFQTLAKMMQSAFTENEPKESKEHIPYDDYGYEEFNENVDRFRSDIAVVRCATVSYRSGVNSMAKVKRVLSALLEGELKHESPLEHVADFRERNKFFANFKGWQSVRNAREEQEYKAGLRKMTTILLKDFLVEVNKHVEVGVDAKLVMLDDEYVLFVDNKKYSEVKKELTTKVAGINKALTDGGGDKLIRVGSQYFRSYWSANEVRDMTDELMEG